MKRLLWLLSLTALVACNKEGSNETNLAPLKVKFNLLAYGTPLDTSVQYTNFSNQRFKISRFAYYVSSAGVTNSVTGNSFTVKNGYWLVDLLKPSSQVLDLNLLKGNYDRFVFTLGVDSTRNVSGAQTGALDPANGMFWTWNTGYIFAKLEGRSPSSPAPFQGITHHIGGFRTGENAIRTITFSVPLEIGRTTDLELNVDIQKWFDGVHTISIADNPAVMSPGGPALKIADNYATMFSVSKVVTP